MKMSKSKEKNDTTTKLTNGIKTFIWTNNVTIIDVSNQSVNIEENIKFPVNLINLNLAHNKLVSIPKCVLNLPNLEVLDVSDNQIQHFDETPEFCHSIEQLNISNNQLVGPPHWIWSENPSKLTHIDLSSNTMLTRAFDDNHSYLEELLKYKTLVSDIKLYNCYLRNHTELLHTFPKVKVLEYGIADLRYAISNHIEQFPCKGFDTCTEIEKLNLSNVLLYTMQSNVDIYKNLRELNVSQNCLSSLPEEFCNLANLEVCILSCNKILYLPNDMVKLKKLVRLYADSNELCMLPESICKLPELKLLDLYDNSLYEIPHDVGELEELDLALNYLDEPEDQEYVWKKEKLRLNITTRCNSRKIEDDKSESRHSTDATDDEELIGYLNNSKQEEKSQKHTSDRESTDSPEDWDSDDYWVPRYYPSEACSKHAIWYYFVKQKMEEGNFCPMDMHPISIAEKVKAEKLLNPKVWQEVEGQFDDLSEDDTVHDS